MSVVQSGAKKGRKDGKSSLPAPNPLALVDDPEMERRIPKEFSDCPPEVSNDYYLKAQVKHPV